LYNELVSGFSKDHISSLDTTKKNSIIQDIMKKDVISGTDIEVELKRYMASQDEFTWLDLSRINIFQLRKKVSWSFLSLKKKQQHLKSIILSDYNISEKQFSQKIESHLDTLSDSQLQRLVAIEVERDDFMQQKLWKKIAKRESLQVISTLSESEISKRLWNISSPEREEIITILAKAKGSLKLDDTDIRILIRSWFLTAHEAKDFVETFIPYITLQKAVDLWLISNTNALKKRDDFLTAIIQQEWVSLDTDASQELQAGLSLSEINVATKDFSLNQDDVIKITKEVGFKNFEVNSQEAAEKISDELKQKWPASFELLKQAIQNLNNPNIQGIEKLWEGSYILFSQRNESWDGTDNQYIKITSVNDAEKTFSFQNAWFNALNASTNARIESTDYVLFLNNLQKTQKSIKVFSGDEVKDQISAGNIESAELQSYRAEDFEWEDNILRRESVQQKQQELLENEIQDLEEKLEKASIDQSIRKSLVEKQLEHAREQLDELKNATLISSEVAKYATFHDLLSRLDSVDVEGKALWLKKWMSIETKENAFIVDGIDIENEQITLNGLANSKEMISFSEFETHFKKQKAKRVAWLENINALLERVSNPMWWGKTVFENGELTAKDVDHKWQKPDQKIEYLVGTESDTLVKIVDINDGYVEIQRWEIEDTKTKKWKKEIKWHKLKIKWASTEKYSLNEFAKYIESEKLKADWKIARTWLEVSPDSHHNDRNAGNSFGGLMWKTFVNGRMSISELIAWGKLVPELIEEYFKKGSDIKSAKAALAMWKFLPQQMRDELLVKVERAESESMEKALEDLGKIDSWMAVERIENWLLDKNTPEYNKEAGLIFMLSKYGHLTAKTWKSSWSDGLYPYRGKWLWYEAFWGRVNDELFLRKKAEAEADNQVFSEETLMHFLMKEQCKDWHYSGIKRRSRLHKEFENKWKSWVDEEFEKWYKDASSKRTAVKMVSEGMDEALWGTTTNALGWAKKAVERWWSLEDMMEISFCLMFSWASFDVDQATYLRMKWLWDGDGQPIVSHRMMSSVPEMQLFNNTVLALSKEIAKPENYGWQYGNIYAEAREIFSRVENRRSNGDKYSELSRLKDSQKFWKKYWEVLSRGLNMSMQPDEKFSKTDTIIKRKKDENSIFKQYYEKVWGYVWEWNYFKEDFVDDAIWETWVFGLNTYKIAKKYLEVWQWGTFKKWSAGEKVWKRMIDDINSTPGKILEWWFEVSVPENRIAQREYIATQLKEISAWLLAAHGGNKTALTALNNPTSLIGSQLNAWWVNIQRDFWNNSAEEIKAWEKKKFFLQIADDIINGWASAEMWINNGSTPVEMLQERTTDKATKAVQSENLFE